MDAKRSKVRRLGINHVEERWSECLLEDGTLIRVLPVIRGVRKIGRDRRSTALHLL
jgi:hypothetical protein